MTKISRESNSLDDGNISIALEQMRRIVDDGLYSRYYYYYTMPSLMSGMMVVAVGSSSMQAILVAAAGPSWEN
jgi:hypothetical protein